MYSVSEAPRRGVGACSRAPGVEMSGAGRLGRAMRALAPASRGHETRSLVSNHQQRTPARMQRAARENGGARSGGRARTTGSQSAHAHARGHEPAAAPSPRRTRRAAPAQADYTLTHYAESRRQLEFGACGPGARRTLPCRRRAARCPCMSFGRVIGLRHTPRAPAPRAGCESLMACRAASVPGWSRR